MKAETPTIQATQRDRLGTRYAKRLRNTGRLPAVIYGHKIDPVHVSVDQREMLSTLKHGAHVVNLAVEGASSETCLVKELQYGYLGDNIIHVDFTRVNLEEEVEVSVHLKFVGVPESAKKPGAILSHPITELDVICKVSEIPGEIKVDLSQLEETFTVSEIQLPPGVRTEVSPDAVVANISFVHEEEPVAEAAEVAEGGTEPEVITERKTDEDAAEEGKD